MLDVDLALGVAGGYSLEEFGQKKPILMKAMPKLPEFTRRGWIPLLLSGLSCGIGCSV